MSVTSSPRAGNSLRNHVVPGQPFPILRFEELLANDALGIDEEISRPRHALVLPDRLGVEHIVGPNGLGIRVGQQRKVDLPPVREVLQYCFAVVADCRKLDSLVFESRLRGLQLDQLPFAVGSPVGRTEKEKNCALGSFQRVEALLMAELIASRECRSLLADGQADP